MSLLSLRLTRAASSRSTGALFFLCALALAAFIGALVTRAPVIAAVLGIASLGATIGVCFPAAACRAFGLSMSVLLTGYVVLGRGFAHIGVSPVYAGELVLGVGLVALIALVARGRLTYPRSPVLWVLLLFMLWGFLRTLPYISLFGLDALRDGVLWGYGVFVFLLVPHLTRERLEKVAERYGDWTPYVLPWLPVGLVLARVGVGLPVPSDGGDGLQNFVKAGDVGVHLGGFAAYQLLQLRSRRPMSTPWRMLLAFIWLIALGLVAATNRGGTLSTMAAVLVVAVVTGGRIARQLASAVVLAILVGSLLVASDVSLKLGPDRQFSAGQIVAGVTSIAGSRDERLEGSRRWRLRWWHDILQYTVHGPYFWTGKGFGINLADEDGYEVFSDSKLRSPHNGHMTVLARSGVPGASLWILLQILFGVSLWRARQAARGRGDERLATLLLWVLAYWMAILVDASFDVYLEGPQGGIWYWSLLAAGIGLAARQRPRSPEWRLPEAQTG